jgi:hypothetical protein
MEIIDGVKVFSNPSTFFKWLWNFEGELTVSESKDVYCCKKLIAKLSFVKKR